jgi:[ribosomal protein S5]-alanine N-acetyltransferase
MSIDAAFTHFPSLTTNRLLLRQIRPQAAEALFATFSDEEAMQFYGHEPHQSLDDTHALIQQIQARYDRREAIRWGITLKGQEAVIGSCGFHQFDPGFHRAETGYVLHRAYWRLCYTINEASYSSSASRFPHLLDITLRKGSSNNEP